jgi:hypothetical protein
MCGQTIEDVDTDTIKQHISKQHGITELTPAGFQLTECGEIDGCKIRAITDAAGPQVVVSGQKQLLSWPLGCHEDAVELGKLVSQNGIDWYDEWFDISDPTDNLFAIFALAFK